MLRLELENIAVLVEFQPDCIEKCRMPGDTPGIKVLCRFKFCADFCASLSLL
jgi:hypothetical protein